MLNKPEKPIIVTVADVMNTRVISVSPEASLEEIIKIFTTYDLNGVPVVDKEKTLLGIITQYDLVVKGSGIHIPTLVKTLDQSKMLKAEKMILEKTLEPLKKLTAYDIMNNDPLFLYDDEPIEEALRQFSEHHRVNPIIVVNKEKKVVGVLSRHDLIKILALKELGKTVDSAIERTERPKKAEATVAKTIEKFRKEFFLLPRYRATRWIIFGVAIFLIGIASSFLFIVKLPDYYREDKEQLIEATAAPKSVEIAILSNNQEVKIWEDISVNIVARVEKQVVLQEISLVLKYDPNFLAIISGPKDLDLGWQSAFKIVNLENNTISLLWIATPPILSPPGEINLGVVSFKALKKGETKLIADFGESIGSSRALDIDKNNVLKEIFDLTLNII